VAEIDTAVQGHDARLAVSNDLAGWRWNPALYRRLKQRGKLHKAALVACARKLLVYANTVVARSTPWLSKSAAT
jgi:transposase